MRSHSLKAARALAITAIVAAALATGCVSTKKPKPEAPLGMNTSDIYRLGLEALKPVADRYIERGDRILLLQSRLFDRVDEWRFVPTPLEIPQDVFEADIRQKVAGAFKPAEGLGGDSRELAALKKAFVLDSAKKAYVLKRDADGYDELVLGRALNAAGYSGVPRFSLTEFSARYPYFIDSLESGMQAAILGKQARGFERLRSLAVDDEAAASLRAGKLVFGTNVLRLASWKDIQDSNKPNPVQKLLLYSVDNAIVDEPGTIAFQLSLRLVDAAKGGQVLWSGSRTMASGDFPASRLPEVGNVGLSVPPDLMGQKREALARALRGAGVKAGERAVLLKIDDIPVFGSYPVTREDFIIERSLESYLAAATGLSVVDKLFKRNYKEPWQLVNAVHYVNPLQSGDYGEFQGYYGARYMIGYRVLWKRVQGLLPLEGESDPELSGQLLGIYIKVVDMGAKGAIVLSDFLPFAANDELEENALYRCYRFASSLDTLAASLRESGSVGDATTIALVNRRMELTNAYLDEAAPAGGFLTSRFARGPAAAVFRTYYDAYEVIRTYGDKDYEKKRSSASSSSTSPPPPPTMEDKDEADVAVAVSLLQTWLEDGLCTSLVRGGCVVGEKLESLYSRYLLRRTGGRKDSPVEMQSLSPILLSSWGAAIKEYYNFDKIAYFSFMDTKAPTGKHIKVPAGSRLALYYPVISDAPDSLQVSIVNVISGDYDYKRDFPLK